MYVVYLKYWIRASNCGIATSHNQSCHIPHCCATWHRKSYIWIISYEMFKISTNLIKCPISAVNPARRQNIKINNILLQIFWLCLLIHFFLFEFQAVVKIDLEFSFKSIYNFNWISYFLFFYQKYEKLLFLKTQIAQGTTENKLRG